MRLSRYILLELLAGCALAAGAVAGGYHGGRALLTTSVAQAAVAQIAEIAGPMETPGPRLAAAVALEPLARPAGPPPRAAEPPPKLTYFLGYSDESLIEPLRGYALKRVKFNRGGSSVSMRVDFVGGGRASFKPDQTNLQSIPRKEVAAYRVNRMIGLSSVAPAIPGAFPRDELVAAMDREARPLLPRFDAEVVLTEDGMVTGSLAWWIPQIVDGKIGGFRIDSVDGIVLWKRYCTVGEAIPEESRSTVAQISDMVAFDFLINNFDRWSGANVKSSPDGAQLYFMDNALSFGLDGDGQTKVRIYLQRCQKFSRKLVAGLRALDEVEVTDVMNTDTGPWPSLLSDAEIAAMMSRREHLLAYIDSLIATYGEENVLVFP